ncbi:HNH endonuclease [Pseudomonas sp. 119P]|uniref:HNH endonuclease n=1 Tax=Pseudomonas auratipiscis TaxID=3115853 RepID=A0AB35WXS6_9PSED|nr:MULTISPECIES: HNH endonuclease [unclassified Pseudomonas]MEE1869055.1 HNH endonuclease [Pseudomonas sp. 120P]MEE1959702.1 HNH endonuclease [Pseudomonas sp. 119P]
MESAELVELLDGPVEAFRLTEKAKSWSPAYRPDCWTQTPRNAYQRRRSNKKPIPQGVRALVFERDGWACLRCGCSKQHRLRADHVVPESKGGLATLQNLQTLCMTCNSWKGVKTIDFRAGDGGAA